MITVGKYILRFNFLSPLHPALSPFGGEEKGEGETASFGQQ